MSMRTVIGIIVGYVIFAGSAAALFQVTQRAPHAAAPATFILVTTIYGMLFAVLGGGVAEMIARTDSDKAGVGTATLIALGALVSLIMTWNTAAHWSQWGALFLMAPMAIVGGRKAKAMRD